MRTSQYIVTLVSLSLAGALVISGCAPHERFHSRLSALHEQFHEHPHTPVEHRRLHENLEGLHEDYHERDRYGYGSPYYRDYYYRGGRYYGWPF